MTDGIEFVRRVIYKGKAKEDYVTTRLRLYKASISKSTASIPPDPDSLLQALKRVHAIVYVWIRSHETHIDHIPYRECGWEWSEERRRVSPVWFVGPQLPSSIRNVSKSKKSTSEYPEDADDESEEGEGGRFSKRKKSTQSPANNTKKRKVTKVRLSVGKRCSGRDFEQLESKDGDEQLHSEDERSESEHDYQELLESDEGYSGVLESDDGTTDTEDTDESDWEMSDFKSSSSEEEWEP